MTDILSKVKNGLMITGDNFDDVLSIHITDVKSYMKRAGVLHKVIESEEAVGAILRGVSDLWNNGSGDVKFSQYFYDRVAQLVLTEENVSDGEILEEDVATDEEVVGEMDDVFGEGTSEDTPTDTPSDGGTSGEITDDNIATDEEVEDALGDIYN